MVLFDDAVVLTHHHPHVSAAQSLSRLPYLFGVAVYAFEVCPGVALPMLHGHPHAVTACLPTCPTS